MKTFNKLLFGAICLLFLGFSTTSVEAQSRKLRVMLDPSHGGQDDGSIYFGVKEKDAVWAICQELYAMAKNSPYIEMKMTRYTDSLPGNLDRLYSQYRRVEIMKQQHSDILVSVHHASDPNDAKVGGTQVFIPHRPDALLGEYNKLGKSIQDAFRGSRIEPWENLLQLTERGGYHILDSNPKPAVLVEIGFITNEHDINELKKPDMANYFAKILLKGIEDYAKSSMPKNPPRRKK